MSGWFERAEQALVDDLAEGLMTGDEFNAAMRDLRAEARQEAEDAAAEVEQLTAEITRLRGIVPDYAMYPEAALVAVDAEGKQP